MTKHILAAVAAILLALPSVSAQSKFAKQLPKELHLPTESITEADRQKIVERFIIYWHNSSLMYESVKFDSTDRKRLTDSLSILDTLQLAEALYKKEKGSWYIREWDDLGPDSETPAMQKHYAYGIRNAQDRNEFLKYLLQYGARASFADELIIGEYCINSEWSNLSDEQKYTALKYAISGIKHKENITCDDILAVYGYSKDFLYWAGNIYGNESSEYQTALCDCASIALNPAICDWEIIERTYLYYLDHTDKTYRNATIKDICNDPLYTLYLNSLKGKDFNKARNILGIMLRPTDKRSKWHFGVRYYGEAYTLLLYSEAQLDYLTGGTDYPQLLKQAYDYALYILSPYWEEFGIKDYIIPTYRHLPSVIHSMKFSYDSPYAGDSFDAALFLKGGTEKFGAEILSLAESSCDTELCEYIDSLRNNFDMIPEWKMTKSIQLFSQPEYEPWYNRNRKFDKRLKATFHGKKLKEIWEYCIVHWQNIRDAMKEDETAIEIVNCIPLPGGDIEYKALILNNCDSIPTAVRLCSDAKMKKILGKGHIYGANAGEIYDAVWKPILPHIKGHRLHLSPIGLLGGVNLAAIPDSNGRSMGEKFDIHFCTSTGWLVERDADEEQSNGNLAKWNKIELWGGLQSLPESGAEIKAIGKLAQAAGIEAAIHSGADCTEESFRAISWKKTGIIHIAAHGFRTSRPQTDNYDEDLDNPMDRCGLILQDGAKSPVEGNGSGKISSEMTFEERKRESGKSNAIDGVLLGSEIARMNLLGTDLVVLSACGSGKGDYTDEGVYSIARAFRKAGAKTVVATLGRIPDGAAKLFMTEFYRHLFAGESKAAAFQAATAALKSNPRYSSPAVWTQFVMYD